MQLIRQSLTNKLHMSGGPSAANCSAGNMGMRLVGVVSIADALQRPESMFCKKCFGPHPHAYVKHAVESGNLRRDEDPNAKSLFPSFRRFPNEDSIIRAKIIRDYDGETYKPSSYESAIEHKEKMYDEATPVLVATDPEGKKWVVKRDHNTGVYYEHQEFEEPCTKTINRGNWTGEVTELQIVTVGAKIANFKLSHLPDVVFTLVYNGIIDAWEIFGSEHGPDHVLGTVDRTSTGREYMAFGSGIDRRSSCRFEAAAQLICNIY